MGSNIPFFPMVNDSLASQSISIQNILDLPGGDSFETIVSLRHAPITFQAPLSFVT